MALQSASLDADDPDPYQVTNTPGEQDKSNFDDAPNRPGKLWSKIAGVPRLKTSGLHKRRREDPTKQPEPPPQIQKTASSGIFKASSRSQDAENESTLSGSRGPPTLTAETNIDPPSLIPDTQDNSTTSDLANLAGSQFASQDDPRPAEPAGRSVSRYQLQTPGDSFTIQDPDLDESMQRPRDSLLDDLHAHKSAIPLSPASPISPFIQSPLFDRPSSPTSPGSPFVSQAIQHDLSTRWILNLSMTFQRHWHREKFFITYADRPNAWRRVTVTLSYRGVPADSLEAEVRSLHYQQDKSARIYEAVRDSLADVNFYDTVTNLKLETYDDRLHIHVTEDVNEIIPYPPVNAVSHLRDIPWVREQDVHFSEHLSGFVYRVDVNAPALTGPLVKKEIPGPDMIDEFLYEVNALHALRTNPHTIPLSAIVVDNSCSLIKGLLIPPASNGPLADLILDQPASALPFGKRARWARQIVQGLAAIHAHGLVHGDVTLSNVVIDEDDNALLIDINRRGCPIGWEPPEFQGLIDAGLRISMYIGVKSDMWQLGMVLWGLGMLEDSPDRQDKLSNLVEAVVTSEKAGHDGVEEWYAAVVDACLARDPVSRCSADEVLHLFPTEASSSTARLIAPSPKDPGPADEARALTMCAPPGFRLQHQQDSGFDEDVIDQIDQIGLEDQGRGDQGEASSLRRMDDADFAGMGAAM